MWSDKDMAVQISEVVSVWLTEARCDPIAAKEGQELRWALCGAVATDLVENTAEEDE